MDIFSNILYVKEAKAELSALAQTVVSVDKYRPEVRGGEVLEKHQRTKTWGAHTHTHTPDKPSNNTLSPHRNRSAA